jgi:hypothetical protein
MKATAETIVQPKSGTGRIAMILGDTALAVAEEPICVSRCDPPTQAGSSRPDRNGCGSKL